MQELTSYPSSFWWNAKLGSWIPGLACHFPKRTRFCYQRPERPIFGDQLQKIMNWYIQSLNADLPLCDGMQNLVVVFPVWLWHVISQRWKRGTDFVISAQKWQFGQFSAVNCAKLWILTFKVSMKKLTSYISSLRWYTKLGGGILGLAVACHFPNVTKGQDFVIRAQKRRFAIFWWSIANNCELLPPKFQCKNWPTIFPLCNAMWKLSVLLPVCLYHVISQKWQKRTGFCHHHPKTQIL